MLLGDFDLSMAFERLKASAFEVTVQKNEKWLSKSPKIK